MSYSNFIIDHTLTYSGSVVEPVTLNEAKLYCRVTNTADDAQIEMMITQARQAIEKATGLCLVQRNVSVWFSNLTGTFQLPFGPVTFFFNLTDENGNLIDSSNIRLIGGQFPTLRTPCWDNLLATYQSGYDCVPDDLKIAILDQVSYDYENRGLDSDSGICEKTWKACQRWTRISPIL
jgi:hypothetical protein